MKKHFRFLTALLLAVAFISCSEQEQMTGPGAEGDNADMLKASGGAQLSITSLSPTSAEIGDVLTITGTKFGTSKLSTSSVIIKGIPVSVYVSWSNTVITVIVPSGAAAGAGTVTVKLRTKYSNAVNFTLLPSSSVTIGTQIWSGANLDVDTYRTGDPIPQETDPIAWIGLTTGAWCYPNNDPVLGTIYGKLYNWYAVNDPRGLAPLGWHVPSEVEWKTLFMFLGMTQAEADGYGYPPNAYYGTDQGGRMKEQGTSLWFSSNVGATNATGFTALPGGYRGTNGSFIGPGSSATFWASTEYNAERAWMRLLANYYASTYHNHLAKIMGFSVRCIQGN
ncbi:MAG: FISUMP domain-containing protein [Bacteroidota bacterium]